MSTDKVVIEIGNVFSKVQNPNGQIVSALWGALSCSSENYWFSPQYKAGRWDGKQRFFNRQTKKFPTGLLSMAIEAIEPYEVECQLIDKRTNKSCMIPPTTFTEIELNENKSLREYQVKAVNDVINNQKLGMSFQRGIINIATNGGKTTIASALIAQLYPNLKSNQRILFVTHSKEIAQQTRKAFENDLGIPVGMVGDSKWSLENVTIALVSTLYSRMKRKHPSFQEITDSTVAFIGDEIHHSSSNSWYEVLSQFENSVIRIGLTGTVDKEVEEKRMKLACVCGDILVKVSNDYLIKNGFSAKPECKMVTIDYPDIDRNMRYYGRPDETGELNYFDSYQKGIVNNTYRNYIIAKVCNLEVTKKNGQVLVLVEHIEHGAAIQRMIEIINDSIRCIFLHGELSSDERQTGLALLKSGDVDVVVSTSILDEGVDVPNINAVVYARGGKSIRKVLQGIGRGLRKKEDGSTLRFYDFIDDTSGYLLLHSLNRYKTLKKEKFEITKINLEKDLDFSEEERKEFMENYDDAFDDEVFMYVKDT